MEDKLGHMMEFSIFSFLSQGSFNYLYNNTLRIHFIILVIGIFYAGLDAIHHHFVKGRKADMGEFYADAAGIVLSQAIFRIKKNI